MPKPKLKAKPPNSVTLPNKDVLQRLNYMHQAAHYLATTSTTIQLSKQLSTEMKAVAKKAVVRMDPSVKRSFCKSCNLILIPAYTSTNRLRPSKAHVHKISITCLSCAQKTSIPQHPEPTVDSLEGQASKLKQSKPRPFWDRDDHLVQSIGSTLNLEPSRQQP